MKYKISYAYRERASIGVEGFSHEVWSEERVGVSCIAWLGLRGGVHGALECSRVACDLERVEVLLELNGPAAADPPNVGDLCDQPNEKKMSDGHRERARVVVEAY
jgi:hypothetical protein